jgi:DNA modification methylase
MDRRGTATSNFGAGRRESHDASGFYKRFASERPEISDDSSVLPPRAIPNSFINGDSRSMAEVRDGEVALVVTSPPYFAGKQYEEELEKEGVPSSYAEYLDLLTEVFAECKRTLEPGGRIAVNVANLGRKPYRSLASDVIMILQQLGLLLRGEIIWQKGEGASGNCAWGSYRSAANPVLRDITERVIVASKGRFDRAQSRKDREAVGLPFRNTLTSDDFMESTLDVWHLAPESAKRVNHPAPFPVSLPERLIRMHTYENDLVLDPFLGSGSTGVAASLTNRRFIGYDLDPSYCEIARNRVANEGHAAGIAKGMTADGTEAAGSLFAAEREPFADLHRTLAKVADRGTSLSSILPVVLEGAGFTIDTVNKKIAHGLTVAIIATDRQGKPWFFDICGTNATGRGGLDRADAVWKALGRVASAEQAGATPWVFVTSRLPGGKTESARVLKSVGPNVFFDAIGLFDPASLDRLNQYGVGGCVRPIPGFWDAKRLTVR